MSSEPVSEPRPGARRLARTLARTRRRALIRPVFRHRFSPGYVVRVAQDPADRTACFAVRTEVFVVEQDVPADIEYDAYDDGAVHVLAVRDDGAPLGTARLLHGDAALTKTDG